MSAAPQAGATARQAHSPTYAEHRLADEVVEARAIMCKAERCPCRWSLDMGGMRLCSGHARALPHDWPAVTERLLWEEGERALRVARDPPPAPRGPLAVACIPPPPEHHAALAALHARRQTAAPAARNLVLSRWLDLRSRERAGEHLTRYQCEAWRAGLRMGANADRWAPAWFESARHEGPDW